MAIGADSTATFRQYRNNTHDSWWKDPGLRKNVIHCTGLYFCVFYLGYDASLLNGLQALPQWQEYFNEPSANLLGLISASLFLPAVITPFLSSALNGRLGRKIPLAIGSIVLIIGTFINTFATNVGTFIAGRVLIGGAGPFGKITAIALLQEIAHPRLRVILASSFYCNYFVGSAVSAWFCYGSLQWGNTEWSWRGPCLLQIMAPLIVLVYLIFIPESPRWLIHHGQKERARSILATYHANGDVDDELVAWEYREILAAIQLERENEKVKFVDFLKTPGNRRRLLVLFTLATGTNWIGNGVISYYLAPVLKLVGVTDPMDISAINGGMAIWNLLLTYAGAFNAERVGRRPLWLTSTIGMLASYIVMTGLSGNFATSSNHSIGLATVPIMFIYYGFYDIAWTPLPFSYAAETLPYHMRLKGLSILLSAQSLTQAFNQWVNPVALDTIKWKYYIVYIVLILVYLIIVYFFFPETRHLSVEEVSVVFDVGRLGKADAAARVIQGFGGRLDEG